MDINGWYGYHSQTQMGVFLDCILHKWVVDDGEPYIYIILYMDVGQNGRPRGPQMLV